MTSILAPRLRRTVAATVLAAAAVGVIGAPAQAERPPITCTAAAQVLQGPGPGPADFAWTVTGRGSCQGDQQGTYFVDLAGAGRSETLGLCSGDAFVRDLGIIMTVTLTNSNTGKVTVLTETWGAPVTTFPAATPFQIVDGEDDAVVGAGTLFNHLFLQCPPGGTPVAQFTWTRRSPS